MTPVERGTYRLVASLIRDGRRKLEKQSKGGVAVDPAQLTLLGQLADKAQAIARGEEQPDLFDRPGNGRAHQQVRVRLRPVSNSGDLSVREAVMERAVPSVLRLFKNDVPSEGPLLRGRQRIVDSYRDRNTRQAIGIDWNTQSMRWSIGPGDDEGATYSDWVPLPKDWPNGPWPWRQQK